MTRTGASGATRAPSVIRKRKLGPAEATFSAGGQISLLVRNSGCGQKSNNGFESRGIFYFRQRTVTFTRGEVTKDDFSVGIIQQIFSRDEMLGGGGSLEKSVLGKSCGTTQICILLCGEISSGSLKKMNSIILILLVFKLS